jgi:ribonuclease HI
VRYLQDNRQILTYHTMEPASETFDLASNDKRIGQLQDLLSTLRMADEVAEKGYLMTSHELANLMDVNPSVVTSRGDSWAWRNWMISRVRRESNQILWQLERIV